MEICFALKHNSIHNIKQTSYGTYLVAWRGEPCVSLGKYTFHPNKESSLQKEKEFSYSEPNKLQNCCNTYLNFHRLRFLVHVMRMLGVWRWMTWEARMEVLLAEIVQMRRRCGRIAERCWNYWGHRWRAVVLLLEVHWGHILEVWKVVVNMWLVVIKRRWCWHYGDLWTAHVGLQWNAEVSLKHFVVESFPKIFMENNENAEQIKLIKLTDKESTAAISSWSKLWIYS